MRTLVLLWLLLATAAHAQLPLPHYYPGSTSIDGMMEQPSQPGMYFSGSISQYSATVLTNRQGQAIKNDIVDVSSTVFTPSFTYMTDLEFLGAQYGVQLSFPVGSQGLSAFHQFRGVERGGTSTTLAVGDLSIYPLILNWERDNGCTWFGYCLNFPTGQYSFNDPTNVGLGLFSQMVQLGEGLYLDEDQTWQLAGLVSYEISGGQRNSLLQIGDHLTLEYGLSKIISPEFSVGLTGYAQYQTSETSGLGRVVLGERDKVVAAGLEFVWNPNPDVNIVLRGLQEFASVNHSQGLNISLTVSVPLWVDEEEEAPAPSPTPP